MYKSFQRFLKKGRLSNITFHKNTKEGFLLEHNKLSPSDMKITMPLLSRFRVERASLFKGEDKWDIDKLRRPFIFWLTSLSSEEREKIKKNN